MNPSLITLLVIAAGCSLVQGEEFNRKSCMKPIGMVPFDHEKFAGEWFIAGQILNKAVPKMPKTCIRANVSSRPDDNNVTRVSINFSMKKNEKLVTFQSTGQPMYSEYKSVWLSTLKTDGADKSFDLVASGIYMQSILATDYEDFALAYACRPIYKEDTDMFDKVEIVEILSRKPEMDGELFKILSTVLGSFGFDKKTMIKIDNSVC